MAQQLEGPQDAATSEGALATSIAAPSDAAAGAVSTVGGSALHGGGAGASAATASTTSSAALPLELGWTRVKRKRRRQDGGDEKSPTATSGPGDSARNYLDENDDDCWDCMDPNCRRRTFSAFSSGRAGKRANVVKGRVVWLLHDVESEWFQGYLLVPGHARPWGLLATVQEIDECLQCSEGGYRQIKLSAQRLDDSERKVKKLDLGLVDWTGGDMMRLESADVKMEPESIVTGDKAAAIVKDLFKGLWRRLLTMYSPENENETSDIGVLDLLPSVAVVHGTMKLVEPIENE